MAQSGETLYILYNANSTILGKLHYGARKLMRSQGQEAACAACDITHGGLSLSENQDWINAKRQIEADGVRVVSWHLDEIDADLKGFMSKNSIRAPAVIHKDSDYRIVMTSADLNACGGSPQRFLEELRSKEVIHGSAKAVL